VVLHDGRPDLLHDRPQPGRPGPEEVLREGIRRGAGDRLLGRLRRGRRGAETEVPAAPAARPEADPALPPPGGRLARLLQTTPPADPRFDPVEQTATGVARGAVHVATAAVGGAAPRAAGAAVGGAARTPAGEAAAAARG